MGVVFCLTLVHALLTIVNLYDGGIEFSKIGKYFTFNINIVILVLGLLFSPCNILQFQCVHNAQFLSTGSEVASNYEAMAACRKGNATA